MANFKYYKDYPLVRKGNELYYGYMGEDFVVRIQIKEEPDNPKPVRVYKISTADNLPKQRAERKNLYEALDIAYTWLELAKKK